MARWTLCKLRITKAGYEIGTGVYYGGPHSPVWQAEAQDPDKAYLGPQDFRASSRSLAKAHVRKEWDPDASFWS